jgi:Protein of unknown function (DUF615)
VKAAEQGMDCSRSQDSFIDVFIRTIAAVSFGFGVSLHCAGQACNVGLSPFSLIFPVPQLSLAPFTGIGYNTKIINHRFRRDHPNGRKTQVRANGIERSGDHVLFHEVWRMERLSKTQKKKEALSLQALGEQLVKLSSQRLKNIDLPVDLLNAVTLAKSLKQHKALVRQMQYIGTLMRKHDPAPILEALQHRSEGAGVRRQKK